MRTVQVTTEFREKAIELAAKCKMPEVKARLERLAVTYQRHLEKLADSPPTAPK